MRSALSHPDAEERRRAIAALSAGEVAHTLDELLALLDDADWRVRREVAMALARARDPATVLRPLVDAVESGGVARRNAAIEALRHIGAAAAPVVLARLAAATGGARRFLIEVLADVGDPSCVPTLAGLLGDGDANIPPAAAEALGRIPGAAARDALLAALAHEDAVVRLAALQAVATRGEAVAFDRLAPLLADPICRRAAVRAAAASDDPRALEAIVAAFADPSVATRAEAAVASAAAARAGRREQVAQALRARRGVADALRAVLDRAPSVDARRAGLECVGLLASPASVAAVLRATEVPENAASAEEALEHFGGDAVGPALAASGELGARGTAALLRWALPRADAAHVPALVRLAWGVIDGGDGAPAAWEVVAAAGDRDDALRLLAALSSRESATEVEHARPLGVLVARFPDLARTLLESVPPGSLLGITLAATVARAGQPVAVEPLREALTAPDPALRAAAVRALAATGHPSARDALEFGLADEDAGVQAAAAEALGTLGAGVDLLEATLRSSHARVRAAAARALARRGGRVRAALLPVLDDPEAAVVIAALEGMGDEATVEDLAGLATHRDPDVASEAIARLKARDPAAAAGVALRLLDHAAWPVRLAAVRAADARDERAREVLRARRERERDELVREAIDAALGDREGAGP